MIKFLKAIWAGLLNGRAEAQNAQPPVTEQSSNGHREIIGKAIEEITAIVQYSGSIEDAAPIIRKMMVANGLEANTGQALDMAREQFRSRKAQEEATEALRRDTIVRQMVAAYNEADRLMDEAGGEIELVWKYSRDRCCLWPVPKEAA